VEVGAALLQQSSPELASTRIKSTNMQLLEPPTDPPAEADFWSDVYRGRSIAIIHRYGRLHVYLDHVLQHNVVFEYGTDALAWLIQRIDQGVSARVH
jgi:hypothetical protein